MQPYTTLWLEPWLYMDIIPFLATEGERECVCVHTLINDSYIIATSMVVLSKLTDIHVHVAAADNETVYLAVCSQLVGRPLGVA